MANLHNAKTDGQSANVLSLKKKWGTAKTHAAVSTKVIPQKVTTCAIMSIVVIMGRLRFTLF